MSTDDEVKGAAKEARRQRQAAQEEARRTREQSAAQRQAAAIMTATDAERARVEARLRNQSCPASPAAEPVAARTPAATRGEPAAILAERAVSPRVSTSSVGREIPYRLSVQLLKRQAGQSAVAAAAYRAAVALTDERSGQLHDYARKTGVLFAEILLPEGAPALFKDRAHLWNAVEASENRCDSQLAREIQLSVPYELFVKDESAAIRLTRGFALSLVDQGMCVDFALHNGSNDSRNFHVHLLATLRRCDATAPHGFGPKVRAWNDRKQLQLWRDDWERRCNSALAKAGIAGQVSARSYESRGIDKLPEPKLGPYLSRKVQRAVRLIRTGAEGAGQAALARLAREYDCIADYLRVKLHNLRSDELDQLDTVLVGLALPAGSRTVRDRYAGRLHYRASEAGPPAGRERGEAPAPDSGPSNG